MGAREVGKIDAEGRDRNSVDYSFIVRGISV